MQAHRFKVGDRVRVVAAARSSFVETFIDALRPIDAARASEVWEVTLLLPPIDGEFQYHVRSCRDGSERLVQERQLTPAD